MIFWTALHLQVISKMNAALTAERNLQKELGEVQRSSKEISTKLKRLHAQKEELMQEKKTLEVREEYTKL